jgi:hypothetical protein
MKGGRRDLMIVMVALIFLDLLLLLSTRRPLPRLPPRNLTISFADTYNSN